MTRPLPISILEANSTYTSGCVFVQGVGCVYWGVGSHEGKVGGHEQIHVLVYCVHFVAVTESAQVS